MCLGFTGGISLLFRNAKEGETLSYNSRQCNLNFLSTPQSVTTKYMFVPWFDWWYHISLLFKSAKGSDKALEVCKVISLF